MCRKMHQKMFFLVCIALIVGLVDCSSAALVTWYEFEGNTNDSSGNGHDGIAYGGPTYAPGKFGQALNFDGVDDYVEIADFDYTNASHEFSLAFWFKVESFPATATNNAYAYLFSQGTTDRNNSLCVWINSTGAASIYTPDEVTTLSRLADPANPGDTAGKGGDQYRYITSQQLADGQWHMYALTVSSVDGGTIYIDGDVVSTDPAHKGAPMDPVTDINLGRRVMDATRYFGADGEDGLLDDVRIYDTALTEEEIEELLVPPPDPAKASNPNPEDGQEEVGSEVTLSWTPGIFADKHDIYIGSNYNDVNDADENDPMGPMGPSEVYRGRHDANSYLVPALLDYDTTYYWKINQVSSGPDYDIYEGDVWQFTTEPHAYPITAWFKNG